MQHFIFFDPGPLREGELELVLTERLTSKVSPWSVPTYLFEMRRSGSAARIGRLSLRIGFIETILRYAGQVDYSVEPEHRGHHFAERACRLILPLARSHGITDLWITCSPDNPASIRTLENLGAKLIEIVTVPDDYPLPKGVLRKKSRYRLRI